MLLKSFLQWCFDSRNYWVLLLAKWQKICLFITFNPDFENSMQHLRMYMVLVKPIVFLYENAAVQACLSNSIWISLIPIIVFKEYCVCWMFLKFILIKFCKIFCCVSLYITPGYWAIDQLCFFYFCNTWPHPF